MIDELDKKVEKIISAIKTGLGDYNQSIENNFREIVKIANPMISDASGFLKAQIDEFSGQLEELGSVITKSTTRFNGRNKVTPIISDKLADRPDDITDGHFRLLLLVFVKRTASIDPAMTDALLKTAQESGFQSEGFNEKTIRPDPS